MCGFEGGIRVSGRDRFDGSNNLLRDRYLLFVAALEQLQNGGLESDDAKIQRRGSISQTSRMLMTLTDRNAKVPVDS